MSTLAGQTKRWRLSRWIALLVITCAPLAARAADGFARIGGVVRHGAGSAAVGAEVAIKPLDGGPEVALRTRADGSYEAAGLAAGGYAVRVMAQGCEPSLAGIVRIGAGQVYRQDAVVCKSDVGGSIAGRARFRSRDIPQADRVQSARLVRFVPSGQAGGFLPATGRHGSSEFHGALYSYVGNDILNARGFFGSKSRHRETTAGGFVGGPVVKNKTFFTYHYERVARRSSEQPGFGNSVPVQAFREGDFSALRTDRAVGADAIGRVLYQGQVFDPSSTRRVGGVPAREAFPNNAIPAAHPLRSHVAAGVLPLVPRPDRRGLEYNHQGVPSGLQIWRVDAPSHHLRLDHSFGQRLRAGLLLSRLSRPAVRNCGGAAGCRLEGEEAARAYSGAGVYEDITTHHVRQQLDWVASGGLLSQTRFVYDEFHITGHPLSAGGEWQDRLWGPRGNGLLDRGTGLPSLTFTGNTRYSPLGSEWGSLGRLANHQFGVGQDLTWIRGRHTLTVGGEYRYHSYPLRGWASNVAGSFSFHRMQTAGFDRHGHNLTETGDPFASFLLGQVGSTEFQIPDFPTISERFLSWHVLHEVSLTPGLTLSVGLRFDYQSAIRERDDNMSTFDPRVPNPGAGGRLGAMVFAGYGPGRIGSRTLENPPLDAYGPRVGLAYRAGERTVVRARYGVHYAGVPEGQITAANTFGFRFHATATDLSNGQRPAYFLDSGFPRDAIVLPPAIDPSVGNGTSPVALARDRATLPRIQDWSLTVQRELGRSAALHLGYHGSRGSRLVADRLVLGPAANSNPPQILALGADVLGSLATSESATGAGVAMPFAGFRRTSAQSLRPFPHMLHIGYMNVPVGNSFYHAFRGRLEKRFSDGGLLQARYAWSKQTGMGAGALVSSDGLDMGPQNPTDTQSLERGLGVADIPHWVEAQFTRALPGLGSGKGGFAAKLLRGWVLAGAIRVQSATPVNVVMANDLRPFLFNGQKRPDIVTSRVRVRREGRADVASHRFYDRAAFADPGHLAFGDASRTMEFVRGFRSLSEDFSLSREAWFRNTLKLRFETQIANALNRTVLCDPNRNWSSASFGLAFAQCNSPRMIRMGFRVDF